jgi:hypothetical protein
LNGRRRAMLLTLGRGRYVVLDTIECSINDRCAVRVGRVVVSRCVMVVVGSSGVAGVWAVHGILFDVPPDARVFEFGWAL